ncbi:hypothetical protein ESO86_16205, partial [Agromyces binzhouensis]
MGEDVEQVVAVERRGELAELVVVLDGGDPALPAARAVEPHEQLLDVDGDPRDVVRGLRRAGVAARTDLRVLGGERPQRRHVPPDRIGQPPA